MAEGDASCADPTSTGTWVRAVPAASYRFHLQKVKLYSLV